MENVLTVNFDAEIAASEHAQRSAEGQGSP
jgi:hypothetical protein